MYKTLSSLVLAINLCLVGSIPIGILAVSNPVKAQSAGDDLFYSFGNQKIPLTLATDTIGVILKKENLTRGETALKALDADLNPRTRSRSSGSEKIEISPLSTTRALLRATKNKATGSIELTQKVAGKSYIQETLPVLQVPGKPIRVLLPNEAIVKFDTNISTIKTEQILATNKLTKLRELKFAKGFYVVKAEGKSGIQVLGVFNKLSQVKGIKSAVPNFIQVQTKSSLSIASSQHKATNQNQNLPFAQWHIDSRTLVGAKSLRTDVYAPEVWKRGRQGEGVIVAVLDNMIQWDHPALVNNISSLNAGAKDALAGESNGWDFSGGNGGDKDTRISEEELAILQPKLKLSMAPDAELKVKYADIIDSYKAKYPELSEANILADLRQDIRHQALGEFHGTMSAGMITGNGSNGFKGIAPKAKILPVRIGGLDSSFQIEAILEGLGYAAARGADVISMSFGAYAGMLVDPAEKLLITELQLKYPKLIFVASAGNDNQPTSSYPAAYDGIISVGATNGKGFRAPYSNYGTNVDLVAPGGDTSDDGEGGVLTLNGVGNNGFWKDIAPPTNSIAPFQDNRGYYVFTQGTSFSAPAVSGVVALMKSADRDRRIDRHQYLTILQSTSSYDALKLRDGETDKKFTFGAGLVNALKAVESIEKLK
jgi:serine protease